MTELITSRLICHSLMEEMCAVAVIKGEAQQRNSQRNIPAQANRKHFQGFDDVLGT